jgi:hypothetical protein
MHALNVNVRAHRAKPRRAARFSPLERSASMSKSAESGIPTPKWKDLSMTLDSLLNVVTSNNDKGERITDSEVF